MKKVLIFILAVITSCGVFLVPVQTAEAMPYFEDATITHEDVNMRMRPTTESPVIMTLDAGTRIGVFCEETEGWYRIIYGNYRGYVSADYVFLPSKDQMVANVVEGGLHLRQNPGTYSTVITDLTEGTGLTIKNINGDWYYVEIEMTDDEGSTKVVDGYVHKDYVKISNAEEASMLLKKGMSGAAVRNIQQELRRRNFMIAAATGYFGDVTEGAVKHSRKRRASQSTESSARKRMRRSLQTTASPRQRPSCSASRAK